jgi:hypothetical protein
MADPVAPEVAKVEVKHFAAGMIDRTSLDREVRAMQNLRNKKDGQAVFEKEIEIPSADLKEPNFKELSDIALEVDNTVNPRTNESRQSLLQKKIEDLQNIITKETPLSPRQLQYVGGIAADIPGVVKSIAKDTGRTEAQVKADLKAAAPSVSGILTELAESRDFVNLLRKNVGDIEPSKEMMERKGKIDSLSTKTTRKRAEIDTTRKLYDDPVNNTGVKQWFEVQNNAAQQAQIINNVKDYNSQIALINNGQLGPLQRSAIAPADIQAYQGQLDAEIANLTGGQNIAALGGGAAVIANGEAAIEAGGGNDRTKATKKAQLRNFYNAYVASARIGAIYNVDPNIDQTMRKYNMYTSEMPQKLTELSAQENTLTEDLAQLATLKAAQGKDVANIAGKVESVMERSVKEYYNNKLLKRAKEIAEWDAQHKTELKQKDADLKEKQKEIAKNLLSKYIRLSHLRYVNGEAKGWDDKSLKKLVKEDLFQHSPADMGRQLLKRVYDKRGDFPDTYKKEIDAMAKEMGVDSRTSFNDILKKMDTQYLADLAADEMPKAFGYARARGYYFDRLRLRRHQVEYVQSAYQDSNFFEKMLEHQATYLKEFDDGTNKELLRSIDMTLRKLRNATVGKDYEEGMKKALKLATAAAAVTAAYHVVGPYTLGKIARAGVNAAAAVGGVASRAAWTAADAVDAAANYAMGAVNVGYTGPRIPVDPTSPFGIGVNSMNDISNLPPVTPDKIPTVQ